MPHSKFGVRCLGIAFTFALLASEPDGPDAKEKAAPKCRTPNLECDVWASLLVLRCSLPSPTVLTWKEKAAPKCRTPNLECDVSASLSLLRCSLPSPTVLTRKRKRHQNAALQIWSAMFGHRFQFCVLRRSCSPPSPTVLTTVLTRKESGTKMPHSKFVVLAFDPRSLAGNLPAPPNERSPLEHAALCPADSFAECCAKLIQIRFFHTRSHQRIARSSNLLQHSVKVGFQ